ncbi:MAG TPA: HlyD family efflux transporter periplasmic adaptor subunit [Rhodocyclaceae bacterium]
MASEHPRSRQRRYALGAIAAVIVVAAAGYGAWWALSGRYHETTDDAYVSGNLVRITPRVPGTVVAVLADDTDYVEPGQVLVRLDDTDARVALARAEADLGETVRRLRQAFEAVAESKARLSLREDSLRETREDLRRRSGEVAEQEAVSREEVGHARVTMHRADADVRLARAQLASAEAAVRGTTIDTHPATLAAVARLREAFLALARCRIEAPVGGYVARRSVQVGQQFAAGTPLMTVVPLDQLWVEANFKEDQLEGLRVGQPVELRSDLYGRDAVFHGRILGIGPGTGSVFSLLPPQNASGNWIKIVQRLPVRVSLDPAELRQHPLRIGLSLRADADIHDQGGAPLGRQAAVGRYEAPVPNADKEVDSLARRIIDANRGSR